MNHDRITQLRICGLRTIEDLQLDLRGLTVLIGDNGTGKSSILEALELLRQAAKQVNYVTDILEKAHGGLQSLLRRGCDELRLGVTIEGAGSKLDYEFAIGRVGTSPVILSERVDVHSNSNASEPLHLFIRTGMKVKLNIESVEEETTIGQQFLFLPRSILEEAAIFPRIINALERVEVHVPFETRPLWQQRELETTKGPRWRAIVEQADALSRYAINLPNAFQQLRNLDRAIWTRVLERAQLGLGEDVRDFRLTPAGRGHIELEIVFGSAPDHPLPVDSLSEGQLSYLAFIALCELHSARSILALDEPELHLHPALLARVVWMLEEVAQVAPVILSTHSDRLLDGLSDPAQSVVLCDLDVQRVTRLHRPDPEQLAKWLQSYRGIGSLRAEGYESHVFAAPSQPPKALGS